MSEFRDSTSTQGDPVSSNGLPATLTHWLNGQSGFGHFVTIMVGIAVLAAIVLLSGQRDPAKRDMLFGGRTLSEQELDGVEISFSRAGLNDWRREGNRISVPTASRNEYLAALRDASSLPLTMRSSVQEAIEKTNIFESASQRISRETHAKEVDLGTKLAAFPEIRWASVEYDQGERSGLSRARTQSASVVVIPKGTEPLTTARTRMIQEFIRASYAGMSAEDVVVIDANASNDVFPLDDPESKLRLEQQSRLEKLVRDVLAEYGERKVAAHIGQKGHASQSALSTESIESADSVEETPLIYQPKSNPKALSLDNGTLGANPASIVGTMSRETQRPEIRLSIGLPESYYHASWSQNSAAPITRSQRLELESRTSRNIRAAVMPTVLAITDARPDEVIVDLWSYPDASLSQTANLTTASMNWLGDHWAQASLVFIGFIGLLILMRAIRMPELNPIGSDDSPATDLDVPSEHRPSVGSPVTTSSNMIESDLLALIEQNPEAAADVIRDWVAEAA